MIMKMFSIKDQKAAVYNKPFFATTHGEAERYFDQLVKDEKSMVFKYPDDFDLYYIGEYDDQSGITTSVDTPKHMCKAISFKKSYTSTSSN